jgi:hypothetical protein
MDTLMVMFQRLVSPEQQELSELVTEVIANGGVKALRNNKILLSLEETASKSSSTPNADGHRALRAKAGDVDDLKNDIFEDPGAAVEKNREVFFRKFEVQKNQITEELKLVVVRESDRVIKEVKGGPHERIRDRVGHLTPHSSTKHQCTPITYRSLVYARDLERYGRYHVAFHLLVLNRIISIGLARECQGSAFRAGSPRLLYGGAHPRVNNHSQSKCLDNY